MYYCLKIRYCTFTYPQKEIFAEIPNQRITFFCESHNIRIDIVRQEFPEAAKNTTPEDKVFSLFYKKTNSLEQAHKGGTLERKSPPIGPRGLFAAKSNAKDVANNTYRESRRAMPRSGSTTFAAPSLRQHRVSNTAIPKNRERRSIE